MGGDLNSQPDSLEMAVLRGAAPRLRDPWPLLRPGAPGFTSNAPDNTLAADSGQHLPADVPATLISSDHSVMYRLSYQLCSLWSIHQVHQFCSW